MKDKYKQLIGGGLAVFMFAIIVFGCLSAMHWSAASYNYLDFVKESIGKLNACLVGCQQLPRTEDVLKCMNYCMKDYSDYLLCIGNLSRWEVINGGRECS